MSDTVLINGLGIDAVIGVHAWERQAPRPLLLDLALELDLKPAGASDALTDTVDYQAVADLAAVIAAERIHSLIEHYADRLARAILRQFRVHRLHLTVHKPGAVAAARTVSVRISRSADDYAA